MQAENIVRFVAAVAYRLGHRPSPLLTNSIHVQQMPFQNSVRWSIRADIERARTIRAVGRDSRASHSPLSPNGTNWYAKWMEHNMHGYFVV